jgi:hypothetical protein
VEAAVVVGATVVVAPVVVAPVVVGGRVVVVGGRVVVVGRVVVGDVVVGEVVVGAVVVVAMVVVVVVVAIVVVVVVVPPVTTNVASPTLIVTLFTFVQYDSTRCDPGAAFNGTVMEALRVGDVKFVSWPEETVPSNRKNQSGHAARAVKVDIDCEPVNELPGKPEPGFRVSGPGGGACRGAAPAIGATAHTIAITATIPATIRRADLGEPLMPQSRSRAPVPSRTLATRGRLPACLRKRSCSSVMARRSGRGSVATPAAPTSH